MLTLIVEIDSREKSRIKPALFFFSDNNNSVNVAELEVGDYVFTDENTGKQVAFEYKTCEDFINSVNENRIFNQAIDQANTFDFHFIVLEYTDEQRVDICDELHWRNNITFTKNQFYSAIASLNTYTTVISAHNTKTCFELMQYQAKKCLQEKAVFKKLKKVSNNSAFNYLNNCVKGIGNKTAENITTELDLHNLEDLLNLDKPMLLTINGVGNKTADSILNKIKNDRKE